MSRTQVGDWFLDDDWYWRALSDGLFLRATAIDDNGYVSRCDGPWRGHGGKATPQRLVHDIATTAGELLLLIANLCARLIWFGGYFAGFVWLLLARGVVAEVLLWMFLGWAMTALVGWGAMTPLFAAGAIIRRLTRPPV